MNNAPATIDAEYESTDVAPISVAIAQSDVMAQLDAAHRYRRSVTRFLTEAQTLATMNEGIASDCGYGVPRGKNRDGTPKIITGPSVRLAEIIASAYGNLQVGARVVEVGDTMLHAEGIAWDMEKNLRATIRVSRRITGNYGRFNDDMIAVTGAAACSIALRNAIFRVVPRAYVDQVYRAAMEVAVGNASTLGKRRERFIEKIENAGVHRDRVFALLGIEGIEDITLAHLETLTGLGTAIKEGTLTLDEAFPEIGKDAPEDRPEGARMNLRGKASAPAPEPAIEPSTSEPPAFDPPEDDGLDNKRAELVDALKGWDRESRDQLLFNHGVKGLAGLAKTQDADKLTAIAEAIDAATGPGEVG